MVIGAGVIGLTTAVALRDAGVDAHIVSRDRPAATTSDIAAAIWYPTMAKPQLAVQAWNARTRDVLNGLAGGRDTGVFLAEIHEYLIDTSEPPWRDDVPGYRRLTADELPANRAAGFSLEVPRVEPPIYLRSLVHRFGTSGGVITEDVVDDLGGLADEYGVVVNCAGLAAGALANDDQVFPIRGHVVLVGNPGITRGILDEVEEVSYVLPRTHEVVLGGTRQVGDWDTTPDPETTRRILRRAAELEPKLDGAEVLGERVGLRPGRTSVRVEAEAAGDGLIIHNYGHGGSGYGLAWGCAEAVVDLVLGA